MNSQILVVSLTFEQASAGVQPKRQFEPGTWRAATCNTAIPQSRRPLYSNLVLSGPRWPSLPLSSRRVRSRTTARPAPVYHKVRKAAESNARSRLALRITGGPSTSRCAPGHEETRRRSVASRRRELLYSVPGTVQGPSVPHVRTKLYLVQLHT